MAVRVVYFIGSPASGKSTQAALLARVTGFFQFETSAFLRKIFVTKPNDSEVIQAKGEYDSGKLVSPEILLKWMGDEITQLAKIEIGIVFANSPRTLVEAQQLTKEVDQAFGEGSSLAVFLKIKKETFIKRSLNRRVCSGCQTPVIFTEETKEYQYCSICGGKLITKDSDRPEILDTRFTEFLEKTMPVIEFFRQKGNLVEVDGEKPVIDIFNEVRKITNL